MDDPGFLLLPVASSNVSVFTSQATFGFLLNGPIGRPGNIHAKLGELTTQSSFASQLSSAVTVTAAMASATDIYHDDSVVKVAIQVRDAAYNTRVKATTVALAAHGNEALLGQNADPSTVQCNTSTTTGYCVASIVMPPAWFNIEGGVVTLQYGIGSIGATQTVGTVTLHVKNTYTVASGVSMVLPHRSLFRGETFDVDVSAQIGSGVKLFWVSFNVEASGLTIVGISSPAKFGLASTTSELPAVNVSAIGQATSSYLQGLSEADLNNDASAAEMLLTISLRVDSAAALDTSFTIGCQVIDLQDYFDVRKLPPNGLATFVDRTGVSISSATGSVFVATESISGMLGYAEQGDLVNMAMVIGTQQTINLNIVGFTVRGATRSRLPAACTSSATDVLQVNFDCTSVFFNGGETTGASSVTVTAQPVTVTAQPSSGLSLDVPFRVWGAMLPVALELEDGLLNKVQDWSRNLGLGCASRYQQTPLRVSVKFASGNLLQKVYINAASIQSNLVSTNTSILMVQFSANNGLFVRGIAAGLAMIKYMVNNVEQGSVDVEVTDVEVQVTRIALSIVNSIGLGGYTTPFVDALGNTTAVATLTNATLIAEFEKAYVYCVAVFSDLMSEPVFLADGLVLSSLNANVVTIDEQFVSAAGTGNGLLVQGQLTSGNCGTTVVGTGLGYVDVNLPLPSGMRIDRFSSKLTVAGDAATAAPSAFSTTSGLRVRLEYPGSVFQLMTTDSRTVYDTFFANGLFSVETPAGVPTIVTNSTAGCNSGVGLLSVSFKHVPVSANISITIVCASSVSVTAHPFPTFTGSNAMTASTLAPFAGSGVYQQAKLATVLHFTDSSSQVVSTAGPTSYTVFNPGTAVVNSSVVSVEGAIVSKVDAGPEGTVDINAAFANIVTLTPFSLTVTDTPVTLVEIRARGPFPSTLHGEAGVKRARSNYDAGFSDGTWFNSIFESSVNADPGIKLPNIISFQLSSDRGASVDAASGIVTLLANDYESITLSASGTGIDPPIEQAFAANLDPVTVGDVDLGAALSLTLPSQAVGVEFDVPVRFNSLGQTVAGIDIAVTYDSSLLTAISCTPGESWPGGNFIENVDNSLGVVKFGGLPTPVFGSAAAHEVAVIRFKLLPAAANLVVGLNATVNKMLNAAQAPVGDATPRAGIASVVSMKTASARRRRVVDFGPAAKKPVFSTIDFSRHRRAACASPPCETCDGVRERGDVNGDCVFDLADAVYHVNSFLLPYTTDSSILKDYFLYSALDADQNGIFEVNDADFLARFNFNNLRYLSDLTVVSTTTETSSHIVINATMLNAGDSPAVGDTTYIFFGIELNNETLAAAFQSSVLSVGSVVTRSLEDAPFGGGLLQAADIGGGVFSVEIGVNVTLANIGISVLQVTTDVDGKSSINRGLAMLGALDDNYPYNRSSEFGLPYSPNVTTPGLTALQLVVPNVTNIPSLASRQAESYRPLVGHIIRYIENTQESTTATTTATSDYTSTVTTSATSTSTSDYTSTVTTSATSTGSTSTITTDSDDDDKTPIIIFSAVGAGVGILATGGGYYFYMRIVQKSVGLSGP